MTQEQPPWVYTANQKGVGGEALTAVTKEGGCPREGSSSRLAERSTGFPAVSTHGFWLTKGASGQSDARSLPILLLERVQRRSSKLA